MLDNILKIKAAAKLMIFYILIVSFNRIGRSTVSLLTLFLSFLFDFSRIKAGKT